MSVRRINGHLLVDVHNTAGVRDDGDRLKVLVTIDNTGAAPFDNDTFFACLSKVFDAKEPD